MGTYSMNEYILAIEGAFSRVIPVDEAEKLVIDNVTVVKINDQKLHGVTIKEEGRNAAPNVYVDQWFDDWRKGFITSEDIAAQIYDIYKESVHFVPVEPAELDFKFEAIKDKIDVRVVEVERNKEYLQDKPHKVMDSGLAVCYSISLSDSYAAAINNDILAKMGVDVETIHQAALENTYTLDPPVLADMQSALFSPERINILESEEPLAAEKRGQMYVLTSESGGFGASKLANPEILEKAATLIGGNVYVLPSSLHEVILLPESPDLKIDDLHKMVKEANKTVVEAKDILSDNVYHYDLIDRKFECMTLEEVFVDENEDYDI